MSFQRLILFVFSSSFWDYFHFFVKTLLSLPTNIELRYYYNGKIVVDEYFDDYILSNVDLGKALQCCLFSFFKIIFQIDQTIVPRYKSGKVGLSDSFIVSTGSDSFNRTILLLPNTFFHCLVLFLLLNRAPVVPQITATFPSEVGYLMSLAYEGIVSDSNVYQIRKYFAPDIDGQSITVKSCFPL